MKIRVVAVLLAVAGLSACDGNNNNPYNDSPTGLYDQSHFLRDGRTVTCVILSNPRYEEGGVDCDWANAK